MRPYSSLSFALVGISIAIFGVSISILGLAFTQVYPGNVNVGVIFGAVVALFGTIVATISALSLKE